MEVSGGRKSSQRHGSSLTFVLVSPNLIPTVAQTIPLLPHPPFPTVTPQSSANSLDLLQRGSWELTVEESPRPGSPAFPYDLFGVYQSSVLEVICGALCLTEEKWILPQFLIPV